jgi:hypothetical protein
MIVQRREFANYLRENSGVKDHSTSSEIIVWFAVCAGDSSPGVLKNALDLTTSPMKTDIEKHR